MLALQHRLWLRRKFGEKRTKPGMILDERSSLKRFGNGVKSTYVCTYVAGIEQQLFASSNRM
jgi:hypothetical protein